MICTIDKNQKKYIIVKKNNNDLIDITNEIEYVNKIEPNKIKIKYANYDKWYSHQFGYFSKLLNVDSSNLDCYIDNKLMTNIDEIYKTKIYNSVYFKIFFKNDKSCFVSIRKIKFKNKDEKTESLKKYLEYLIEVSIALRDSEDADFLEKQIKSIDINEKSILFKIFEKSYTSNKITNDIILPFSANKSQIEAIKNSQQEDISIIQGPPGTGKTQTILNIIANSLIRNETIAVLSGNNTAIKNVYEKLDYFGYGQLNATLGNKENISNFFSNINNKKKMLFNVYDSNIEIKYRVVCDKINELSKIDLDMMKNQSELDELSNEKKVYEAHHDIAKKNSNIIKKLSFKKKQKLLKIIQSNNFIFIKKIELLFLFKNFKFNKVLSNKDQIEDEIIISIYNEAIKNLNENIEKSKKRLDRDNFSKLKERRDFLSKQILNQYLNNRFTLNSDKNFNLLNYKNKFEEFVQKFPIIYSTTNAIKSCSGKDFLYDCVIIDESSQVDMLTATIALSCAKRVVIVGDSKQLQPVLKDNYKEFLEQIFLKYNFDNNLNFVKNSLLDFANSYTFNDKKIKSVFLNEHYRCDPEIINFCNKMFYNDKLIVRTKHKKNDGLKIITHDSNFGRDLKNEKESAIIKDEIIPLNNSNKICCITLFNNQVDLLKDIIASSIPVYTVHKAQGQEKEIIILSTVENKINLNKSNGRIDFLENPNLINVAISRAKNKLYVVINENIINQKNTIMFNLCKYQKYYCEEHKPIKTRVYSVFDILFNHLNPQLQKFKEDMKKNKISNFDSENIIATVLNNLFRRREFSQFSFVFEYPFRQLIDTSLIKNNREHDFATNKNTHIDFIIYNKFDKSIVLAIEVDGKQHLKEPQFSRDKIKDKLLKDYKINELRISTVSTNVEEKIIKKLINS